MKGTFKKLVCVMLVLSCVALAFVGCGGNAETEAGSEVVEDVVAEVVESEEETEEATEEVTEEATEEVTEEATEEVTEEATEETEEVTEDTEAPEILSGAMSALDENKATKVAEKFMDAFFTFDFGTAIEYMADGESYAEELPFLNIDDAIEEYLNEDPAMEAYADEFQSIFNAILDKVLDSISYEITDVDKSDDEFEFTVNLTSPDVMMGDSFSDFIDGLMSDVTTEERLNEIALELLEDGVLTEESSEEEAVVAIMDVLAENINEYLDEIEFEAVEETLYLVVSKVDGEWLVNMEKSY